MQELKPLFIQSIAPISWTFLQTDTHLLHKIHLLKSLTIDGDKSSIWCLLVSPSYSIPVTLNFTAKFCNSQFPFLVQVKQSRWWFDNIKSNITFLASITSFECVFTTIPSSTFWMHEVANPLLPSTCTMHILQSPISFISFKKHNVGISILACLAACSIVVPSSTCISLSSIFKLIIFLSDIISSYFIFLFLIKSPANSSFKISICIVS